MAGGDTLETVRADDGFEAFYAEKIWDLIPAIYRDEDATTATPGALRAFVEVLAGQAAVERRSVERLWADAHITDCDEWAIPYIADLLGTRLVSAQNAGGRRADVANTIAYRRRAGTVQLLARLADDIAGWDAVASEAWKRLFRTWHSLDCPPPLELTTRTPRHGWANLRGTRIAEIADSAWDEFAHFPDFRRHRGLSGRYNIPKANLHIFRQFAFLVTGATPRQFDPRHYTFDPSGRDVALFKPGRPLVADCREGAEWEVRGPLSCGLLNDARYRLGADAAAASIGAGLLAVENETFRTAAELVARAAHIAGAPLTAGQGLELLDLSLLEDSPKAQLVPDALALAIGTDPEADTLRRPELAGGDLSAWESLDPQPWPWVRAVVDPSRGRVWLDAAPADPAALYALRHNYGRFAPIGAGTHDRRAALERDGLIALPDPTPPASDAAPFANFDLPGTPDLSAPNGEGAYQINDSRTYLHRPVSGMTTTADLTVQAADRQRPYIRLNLEPGTTRWVIDADNDGDSLTLDGLWLGLFPDGHGPVGDASAAPLDTQLVIVGNFETVTLRNMTLDPGGVCARVTAGQTEIIPNVTLLLESAIDRLVIERCITGPIAESVAGGDRCTAAEICINDSIVMAPEGTPAIATRTSPLTIARSTIFGGVEAARLLVEDTIVQGTLTAQDKQGSCVRYSAAVTTDVLGIPSAYRCVAFEDAMPDHLFVSRRFGDAGLAQLSESAPETIRRGAESTSEMGVFHDQIDAIKRDDLIRKLSEFTPINVITQLVFET